MNDKDKPFFSEPAAPQEDDLSAWLLIFYSAWEREFYAALGNVDILVSDKSIKDKLMDTKAMAEKAKDEIGHIIHLGNGK